MLPGGTEVRNAAGASAATSTSGADLHDIGNRRQTSHSLLLIIVKWLSVENEKNVSAIK